MQAVPQVGGLLLLLAGAAVLLLIVGTLIQLLRRRPGSARRLGVALAGLVVAYAAGLVFVGLVSTAQQLKAGDTKCFDDWCAAMTDAHRDPATSQLLVKLRLENHGRGRAMKSDLARAYVEIPGRGSMAPTDGRGMQTVIDAGGHADIELVFDAAAVVSGARFVVAEGSDSLGPGTLTIGDEVSPFHARAGWPLAVA